ncbi:SdpI family protein [Brevibacillus laterosporus]|uniref:SdpI family protein n=1 Tax=Brevibacillus laterosporus TaxID=1465 RepID=UPI00144411C5|nr:SdpI family protein [Brevibacillus laterosporus]NKQ20581.1 SdpI family protein [Brevibacillus laterosporus]WNX32521.1 SdpI family protein [Brevibacillus laterosporus]
MKKHWFFILIFSITILISICSLPYLPNEVAMHWNASGEIDRYNSKWYAVGFAPFLMLLLYVMMNVLPKFDPRQETYTKTKSTYLTTRYLFIVFMLVMHCIVILTGLGYNLNIGLIVNMLVGLLFVLIGNVMPRMQPSYFVGIKTPWTLASDEVWRKTHFIGGRLFVLGGILVIVSSFLPPFIQSWALLVILVGTVVITYFLSYLYYRQIKP